MTAAGDIEGYQKTQDQLYILQEQEFNLRLKSIFS